MKNIVILFTFMIFTGCALIDPIDQHFYARTTPIILQPNNNPISNKLISLNIGLQGSDIIKHRSDQSHYKTTFNSIFKRSIEHNICEYSEDKWGYIDYNITFNNFNTKYFNLAKLLLKHCF